MTVRDWIARESTSAPKTLVGQVLRALGPDAERDVSQTGELCLMAATRALDQLVVNQRFKREDALELLTIDALMTFAYEHASRADGKAPSVDVLVDRGAQMVGQLVTQRV